MGVKRMVVPSTLVLVTDQFACERIIKSARVVADLNQTELLVLSVMQAKETANPAALEHLFGVAKEYGAAMTVAFSDDPYLAIVEAIAQHRVINAVTGVPNGANSMLVKLWKTQKNVNFFTVTHEGELYEVLDRAYQSESEHRRVKQFIENGRI